MHYDLESVRRAIRESNAGWTAAENAITQLPPHERRRRLGAVPPPGTPSLQERELRAQAARSAGAVEAAVPTQWNWLDVNGQNYVSSVKDQGSCGCCVAFGTAAAIDAGMLIAAQQPVGTGSLLDVSEAQLFYCGAGAQDRNCETGWWPDGALAYASNPGLVPEFQYPYTSGDQACAVGSLADATTVSGYRTLTSTNDMKVALSTFGTTTSGGGPLIAAFSLYDDLYSYSGGVYTRTSNQLDGGHCVCVIGYDDDLQAWGCKNSWGPDWGIDGFFWIGYGQCGFDAEMWQITGFQTIFGT